MKLDELYILLVLNNAQMNAGFAESGAAGDRMAVQIDAGLKTVQEAMLRVDASVREMATSFKVAAGETEMSMGALAAKQEADMAKMATLNAEAAASNAKLGESLKGAGAEAGAASSKFGVSTAAAKNMGLAAAAVGYEAVKMAGDFQQVSEKLVTSAGEDQKALENIIRPGLIAQAGQLGVSVKQLAADMYPIESAGYHGAAALKVMEAAEKGAKAEMADGTHVADALTSALHDYYPKAQAVNEVTQRSKEIMSGFLAATSQGKMSFDQLAAALNNVLPTAATLHIKMEDVLGTLASMTAHGISAQQASENLNHAMQKLAQGGTTQMRGWAASVGIDLRDIQQNLGQRGIAGSLQMMDDAIKKHLGPDQEHVFLQMNEAVSKSTPAVKSLTMELASGSMAYKDYKKAIGELTGAEHENGAEMLTLLNKQNGLGHGIENGVDVMTTYGAMWKNITGDMTTAKVAMMTAAENTDYTNQSIKKIGESMKDGKGLQEAWVNVQKNFNQQMAQAKEGAMALVVAIGMKLLPVLTPVAHAVGTVTTWLSQNKTVATALAMVIGGVLTTALLAFAAKGVVALANLSAQFILNTAKGAVWVVTKIAQLFGVQVAVEAEATAEAVAEERGAARRLAAAIGGGVKWLAVKSAQGVAAVASATYYAALSYLPWVWAGAKQLASATVDGAKWLAVKVAQGVAAAASAAFNAAAAAVSWAVAGAAMVASAITKGAAFLAAWVATNVAAMASSIASAAAAAAAWVAANIAMIVATGGIILAIGALILIGYEIVKHWQDIKRVAGEVWNWIKDRVTQAWHAIGDAVSAGINWVTGLFSGLPGRLLGALGNLGSMFWNVGMDILKGIWAGIQAGWSWLTSNVSALASNLYSAAKSALGIGSPSKVFADEIGRWIPPGIAQGINQSAHIATGAASDLAGRVTRAASGGSVSGFSGSGGGSGGAPVFSAGLSTGGGAGGISINLQVAGSVWTTGDLVKEVQTAMLRHGIRNNNPGINYTFA